MDRFGFLEAGRSFLLGTAGNVYIRWSPLES